MPAKSEPKKRATWKSSVPKATVVVPMPSEVVAPKQNADAAQVSQNWEHLYEQAQTEIKSLTERLTAKDSLVEELYREKADLAQEKSEAMFQLRGEMADLNDQLAQADQDYAECRAARVKWEENCAAAQDELETVSLQRDRYKQSAEAGLFICLPFGIKLRIIR